MVPDHAGDFGWWTTVIVVRWCYVPPLLSLISCFTLILVLSALGPVLSGCKKSVLRNQKSKSKTDKRVNLFFQSRRTCRHAGLFFKTNSRRQEHSGRVRGKSHHVLPSSARSAVRLHKPGGAMRAPRATRAQRTHRLATITKRVSALVRVYI